MDTNDFFKSLILNDMPLFEVKRKALDFLLQMQSSSVVSKIEVPEHVLVAIEELIKADKWIMAIKVYRLYKNCSLLEGKEFVKPIKDDFEKKGLIQRNAYRSRRLSNYNYINHKDYLFTELEFHAIERLVKNNLRNDAVDMVRFLYPDVSFADAAKVIDYNYPPETRKRRSSRVKFDNKYPWANDEQPNKRGI